MYVIKSKDGYWSNEMGWVDDIALADKFNLEEREKFNLPIGRNVRWRCFNVDDDGF